MFHVGQKLDAGPEVGLLYDTTHSPTVLYDYVNDGFLVWVENGAWDSISIYSVEYDNLMQVMKEHKIDKQPELYRITPQLSGKFVIIQLPISFYPHIKIGTI